MLSPEPILDVVRGLSTVRRARAPPLRRPGPRRATPLAAEQAARTVRALPPRPPSRGGRAGRLLRHRVHAVLPAAERYLHQRVRGVPRHGPHHLQALPRHEDAARAAGRLHHPAPAGRRPGPGGCVRTPHPPGQRAPRSPCLGPPLERTGVQLLSGAACVHSIAPPCQPAPRSPCQNPPPERTGAQLWSGAAHRNLPEPRGGAPVSRTARPSGLRELAGARVVPLARSRAGRRRARLLAVAAQQAQAPAQALELAAASAGSGPARPTRERAAAAAPEARPRAQVPLHLLRAVHRVRF